MQKIDWDEVIDGENLVKITGKRCERCGRTPDYYHACLMRLSTQDYIFISSSQTTIAIADRIVRLLQNLGVEEKGRGTKIIEITDSEKKEVLITYIKVEKIGLLK